MLKTIGAVFYGVVFGGVIGFTFLKFGIPSNNLTGLHFQQLQHVNYRKPAPAGSLKLHQGIAKSLPQNILNPLSDLHLRRLWGNPAEDLPVKPKYLLTITVGLDQKDLVNQAVGHFSKDWQIMLFHYDGHVNEWDVFDWAKSAIHVSASKQAKWWYAKRFLHPDIVDPYEYIFIWDEDLDLEHFDSERYIELVEKYGLEISQPALEPDRGVGLEPDWGVSWQMTKRQADVEVHRVAEEKPGLCSDPHKPPCEGFVEIMAPVFSRKAWQCVWYIIQNDLVHGWGLDFRLHRCIDPALEKIGVVDAQWIQHKVIPSLGQQGEPHQGKPAREVVLERCRMELDLYMKRWERADANGS